MHKKITKKMMLIYFGSFYFLSVFLDLVLPLVPHNAGALADLVLLLPLMLILGINIVFAFFLIPIFLIYYFKTKRKLFLYSFMASVTTVLIVFISHAYYLPLMNSEQTTGPFYTIAVMFSWIINSNVRF